MNWTDLSLLHQDLLSTQHCLCLDNLFMLSDKSKLSKFKISIGLFFTRSINCPPFSVIKGLRGNFDIENFRDQVCKELIYQ